MLFHIFTKVLKEKISPKKLYLCGAFVIKGSLRHAVSACIYCIAARFQRFKTQRNAFSAIRKFFNEIALHCGKLIIQPLSSMQQL
jgi:hypothetical protein